jgi:hypothetical protein
MDHTVTDFRILGKSDLKNVFTVLEEFTYELLNTCIFFQNSCQYTSADNMTFSVIEHHKVRTYSRVKGYAGNKNILSLGTR